MDTISAFLLLNRLPHWGPKRILRLYQLEPQIETIFFRSERALRALHFPKNAIDVLVQASQHHHPWRHAITSDLKWFEKVHHHIVVLSSDAYPKLLKETPAPPPVLYAKGHIELLNQPTISIIGTRSPSVGGHKTAYEWAKQLSQENITIVSGLARGIDGQAHKGALKGPGKTIAILGAGIDCIYPKEHAILSQEVQRNGLLVTEFPLETRPKAGHFPRRNRIISGLCMATLVIEASLNSGTLVTAHLALDQNRTVMALPGSIYNPQAKGCHYLLQQGATLVTSTQEVLNELNFNQGCGGSLIELDSPTGGTGSLTQYIGFDVTTVDEIVAKSGLPVEDVITDLAELELLGQISAVRGGYIKGVCYER